MSTLTNNRLQALSDNVWLHFFQMGHFSSTGARPTVLVRGEGSRVWDQDGNEYIDGLSGLFAVNVGYGRREIIEAISAQLNEIAYVSPFSFPSLPLIDLSARLAAISPTGPRSRVFLTTGGSDAVETALKIAKAYQRRRGFADRSKIIARRVSYHGTSLGALSVNGVTSLRNGFGPLVPGARHVPLPYRYRCDYCALHSGCRKVCVDEVERLIEFEGPETIAAIIMEPVQNSGGAIVSPPGYLQHIRQICDHYGIVMIVDEVICGFGRVGDWFGSTAMGVQPDIITTAKAMTSGYAPLGAAIVRDAIADVFVSDNDADKFMHGITFGGHAASCAAALANLDIIEREHLLERSREMGAYLMRELEAAVGDHPNVGEVRGMGMFMAVELVRDRTTRESLAEERLMVWLSDQLKQRGLICRADDRLEPVIQLAPPLILTREEADRCVRIVAEAVHALGRKLGSTPAVFAMNPPVEAKTAVAAD
ncbi:aspartate aminotransferase family protein [Chloroflexus sp.]|uniref:aminotransferase family protein n=1 Tax=Chloroflexus sp. TaxID=1904827 RepID=UPI002ACE48DB|nr:aminotransferase class III-fold pyridoxal phosphate-dependent enzyme [Chloroflexus sp.]